jgi:glycosyltransferase involved in cell wall biosynthesis
MISVIIPCYNVDKYIKRCLDSLVSQTIFNQLQVICVDDGSSDCTADLIRGYQSQYQNIILKTQTNQGQSAARNKGLKFATGDFIGFIDSDDWVNNCYYEELLKEISSSHADIAFCNMVTVHENGNVDASNARGYPIDQFSYLDLSDKSERKIIIKTFLMDRISVSPCNKLIRSEFLKKSELDFSIGLYNEDMEFTFDLLMRANKITKTEKSVYSYWQRTGSTTSESGARVLDMLKIVNNIKKKTQHRFGDEMHHELIHFELFFSIYLTLLRLKHCGEPERRMFICQTCNLLSFINVKDILFSKSHPVKRKFIFLIAKYFPKAFSYLL